MSTDLELALALLGGAPFTSLHEGVKEAVRTTARFRYLLRDLKNTLESLQRVKRAIERIQLYNEELSLPAGEIEDLQKKMKDGAELVFRLSNLRLWNYCCLHCYNDELVDLDRSLRRLFENLHVEESRNVLEILELSRNTQRTVDELKSKLEFNTQREFDELKSILSNMERNLIQQHEANYDRQQEKHKAEVGELNTQILRLNGELATANEKLVTADENLATAKGNLAIITQERDILKVQVKTISINGAATPGVAMSPPETPIEEDERYFTEVDLVQDQLPGAYKEAIEDHLPMNTPSAPQENRIDIQGMIHIADPPKF